MSFSHRTGYVNPRLGTYFGIFMSAFAALAMMTLIFEGLGVSDDTLRLTMFAGPIGLYAAIGIASFTNEPLDYFASGRRVPAFYTGLVLAQTAIGATGLVALTGAFFLIGFDALCIVIGGLAGFVVMAVLLAPFFRKFGAFTVPSYLGKRFDSRALRLTAAGILAVPMLLVLAAELRIGAHAIAWFYPISQSLAVMMLVAVVVLTLAAGGMRSLAWSSSAQSIAALLALLVPVAIVAVIVTNLPLPQLSAGPVLRTVGRAEAAQGLPIILPPMLAFDMPGEGLSPIAKRYSDAFGSVGPLAFIIVTLSLLAGVASAPWLLPRVAGTPGVYEARKSLGWATLLFGIAMLTIGSVAIFMRDYLTDIVTVAGTVRFPQWFETLQTQGILAVNADGGRPTLSSFSVSRDDVLLSLPVVAEMPAAVVYLAAGGVVAAALATAGAVAIALGNILSEDIVNGLTWLPTKSTSRLIVARLALGAAAALAGFLAIVAPTDPLELLLWAIALTGASTFPVLVLSIWWKRLNEFGATAGILTGFCVTVLAIIAGEAGLTGTDGALAAAIGLPAGAVAAIAVALATPAPPRNLLELVRDIRVPGGEILYDREMRQLRRRKI
ncbi:sodium:solute symporter [Hyphomicrobium sp. CS1GBMeth3]|uniref:solute symporter family protein n=1 Tax=Hyphomicrobium sp. CS1GBMeth3 TaxID=1892845 RepID=UPI0009312B44|nr:sodium:solute symporter [Hyphomicrobium sp. CS1GBMeth3]